ncbi:MAG: class I SAM-dependent methyltransferase [Planctomycetia bacterium]|nr:class I SAM-dependent methyltransferase [Planctomycetia bacterium]
MLRWFRRQETRAARVAAEDRRAAAVCTGRRFETGTRPVIRWIKGDGLDDQVTRAAIAQATRLFGSAVDYCLCTQGIAAPRAREILSWSAQPVEWWPVTEHDNPVLARLLQQAGCPPEHFGYWWKWFPERVRPAGPEWILDGDMVVTGKPAWFDQWLGGKDRVRVSQDDRATPAIYGRYSASVDPALQLYSGLVSLPSDLRFMRHFQKVLAAQRLAAPHDGRSDMCEQGVVAAAFQRLDAVPIPLHEFPFARAFEDFIDYGVEGDRGRAWGYHFGHAFRRDNPHFHRLVAEGVVFSQPEPDLHDRFEWLGGVGQWGIPGWAMPPDNTRNLVTRATIFRGRDVLEIGTSRGRVTAQLATLGCNVTSVDHQDRGASGNLAGLGVDVIVDDAVHWLTTSGRSFDLVVCDVHGNSPAEWRRFAEPLQRAVRPGGTMIISNAALARIPEWHEETGVPWFLDSLPAGWTFEVDTSTVPGLAVVTRP